MVWVQNDDSLDHTLFFTVDGCFLLFTVLSLYQAILWVDTESVFLQSSQSTLQVNIAPFYFRDTKVTSVKTSKGLY